MQGTYHLPASEFADYSAHLADVMQDGSLRRECGIDFLRFYQCQHGMRLPCGQLAKEADTIADADHPHIDVVQLHRADTLTAANSEDCLMVRIGGRGRGTLQSLLPSTFAGRLAKYRAGFLADFGHFRKHCTLPDESAVTFIQAYNAAAKMARPTAMTLFAAALLCHMFRATPGHENVGRIAVQSTRALCDFVRYHVRENAQLRIEEVHTVDPCTIRRPASAEIARLGSCDPARVTYTLHALLNAGLLYRISEWPAYVNATVGDDLRALVAVTSLELLPHLVLHDVIPTGVLDDLMRAEYRLQYFCHGASPHINYRATRSMMLGGTESAASDGNTVHLRPMEDDKDHYLPIYSSHLPHRLLFPVRCLWATRCVMSDQQTQDASQVRPRGLRRLDVHRVHRERRQEKDRLPPTSGPGDSRARASFLTGVRAARDGGRRP